MWISAHKRDKSVKAWHLWFALARPIKGTTESTRSIIPLFLFHTLYKAEFKALSTSIIKAIYTGKKKKRNTPIYRSTHPACSPWLCVLYISKLFNLPTVFILQHCKGGHLVQLLRATDYQWCELDSLDIFAAVELSCFNMAHAAQSRGQKQKRLTVALDSLAVRTGVTGKLTGGIACTM